MVTQLTEPDPIDEVALSDSEWRERFGINTGLLEAGVNELARASFARLARAEARLDEAARLAEVG
jgi:hypothetical protein